MTERVACDCLINCGDDPWLRDGRADPCEGRARYLAREKARADLLAAREEVCARFRQELDEFPDHSKFVLSRDEIEALVIALHPL